MFGMFDLDGNGSLDPAEIAYGMGMMSSLDPSIDFDDDDDDDDDDDNDSWRRW